MNKLVLRILLFTLLVTPISISSTIAHSAQSDPYPSISCAFARQESQKPWFPSGKTYSNRIQAKLEWCGSSKVDVSAALRTSTSNGVWPNTNTRFYPGIYLYTDKSNPEPSTCTQLYNSMFGSRASDYVYKDSKGNQKSYLGCFVQIELKKFYKDPSKAPHAYSGTCSRSSVARNPGWSNYNWSYLESFLNLPIVKNGNVKIYLQLQDTYAKRSPLPSWMHNQKIGYRYISHYDGSEKWSVALWRREAQYALMDLSHAIAKRFKGDKRLSAIQLPESFSQARPMPSDYIGTAKKSGCGRVGNIDRSDFALKQGRVFQAHGIKEGDPNMLVIVMNAGIGKENGFSGSYTAKDTPITWGNKSKPSRWGLMHLPGQWGVAANGPLMFQNGCGTRPFGELDCKGRSLKKMQRHALANDRVVSIDSQSNEWKLEKEYLTGACCRKGNQNPWGYNYWKGIYAYWPGHAGKYRYIPTPAEWVWYYSGKPRKQGAAANSKLGQYGPDPAGVIPAHYFVVRVLPERSMVSPDNYSRVVDTRTAKNYLDAFKAFGPKGTGAMISFPKGY